jgi:hypothetical protein
MYTITIYHRLILYNIFFSQTAGSTFHGDEPILQQAPNDNGDEPVSLQDG